MNSSLRSMSLSGSRQSLPGSALDSSALAALGLAVLTGAIRVREALATFSRVSFAWAFSARLVEVRNFLSSLATTLRTMVRAAGVPRISLVWPSNWGSASRTVTTAVSPSRTSSLTTSGSAVLRVLDARRPR